MSTYSRETDTPTAVTKDELEELHEEVSHAVARGYSAIENGTLHLDPEAHEAVVELEETVNATTD